MTFSLSGEAKQAVEGASDGLHFIAWLRWAADSLDEDQRGMLSYAATSLVNRGWISPLPKFIESTSDALGLSAERAKAAVESLLSLGLLGVEDDKIVHVAATLQTKRGALQYIPADEGAETVFLAGPVAALGIARGLGRPGKVLLRTESGDNITFECDETGIYSRSPESAAMFLPAWAEGASPFETAQGGGLFLDDDALSTWQSDHGEPDGMPLSSFMLPLAATDLGEQLGVALESMLDRVANFA